MRLEIRHTTRYRFSEPVVHALQRLRLTPKATQGQEILAWNMELEHAHEELAYDEDGNPLAVTFMDYLIPSAAEVPAIEYGHVFTPGPGPGGYKGVGEGGAIGAPPAVVNAVADALAPLGVTINRLPLSPGEVIRLVQAAEVGNPANGGR